MSTDIKYATFGNGCFWCTEAIFQQLKGVISVESGYSGGHLENPTYEQVCTGTTGHAEVVRLSYDPTLISFEDILEVFWKTHDPTTLNRQGNDIGTQYRSVIFYHDEAQKNIAEAYKKQLEESGVYPDPIVTAIEPLTNYFPAEDYHRNYVEHHQENTYCQLVVKPKIAKFQKQFVEKLK